MYKSPDCDHVGLEWNRSSSTSESHAHSWSWSLNSWHNNGASSNINILIDRLRSVGISSEGISVSISTNDDTTARNFSFNNAIEVSFDNINNISWAFSSWIGSNSSWLCGSKCWDSRGRESGAINLFKVRTKDIDWNHFNFFGNVGICIITADQIIEADTISILQ